MKQIVRIELISRWLHGCVSVLPLRRAYGLGALVPESSPFAGPVALNAMQGACGR
jgi:hypothetical protein